MLTALTNRGVTQKAILKYMVRPVLICDVRNFQEENKVKLQTKLSDFLLIVLPS